ncbi:MAG: alpha-amylase/alpha-mannosidase (GH57 family) [Myxococcota bacterium]|jgi:alpha-amylase/alpha-mannosidase (GH57 family)
MKLVLLWHLHQPPCSDPRTGKHLLPWARLHAARDYADMVRAVLDAPEGTRCTFSLSPSLVDQLIALAKNPEQDRLYQLCRTDPDDLSFEDACLLVGECLSVSPETMIAPYPRYAELAAQDRRWLPFSRQDVIDAVVWVHLAWSGAQLRRDPVVQALLARGRDFSLADRDALLDRHQDVLKGVLSEHQKAADSGRVELCTTPYFHPILPLLCRAEVGNDTDPDLSLPMVRFRYPSDADRQIRTALDHHLETFGVRANGMWPPAGAVCPESLALLKNAGVNWVASDESVLERVVGWQHQHDRVWSSDGIAIFFQDRELSDRLSFVYSRREPERAADDLVAALRERALHSDRTDPVITIAVDGQQPWDHYPGGSDRFTTALYARLAQADDIVMTTPSECLRQRDPEPLATPPTGSALDASFRHWIGEPVKNQAWELLAHARTMVAENTAHKGYETALAAVLRAQASDWLWWYGDGHYSPHEAAFDRVYRAHLTAAYSALDVSSPVALSRPLAGPAMAPTRLVAERLGVPEVTGSSMPYYKWASAGYVALQQGWNHKTRPMMTGAHAIYDADVITLRLDTGPDASRILSDGYQVVLHVVGAGEPLVFDGSTVTGDHRQAAVGRIVEVALDNDQVGDLRFWWSVTRNNNELERFPRTGELVINVRGTPLDLENWVV